MTLTSFFKIELCCKATTFFSYEKSSVLTSVLETTLLLQNLEVRPVSESFHGVLVVIQVVVRSNQLNFNF